MDVIVKNMKLFFVVVFVFSSVLIFANTTYIENYFVAQCATGQFLIYNFSIGRDREVYVAGFYNQDENDYGSVLSIPSTVSYGGDIYAVKSIANQAFYGCNKLEKVIIGSNILLIGNEAFARCNRLKAITVLNDLGRGLTSIGNDAFYDCDRLDSLCLGDNLETIGDRAFYDCDRLRSVIIPNSATLIGDSAFANCDRLETVVFGESLREIKNGSFKNCQSLESVTMYDNVKKIGDNAFRGCERLLPPRLSNNITDIGDYAFYGCSSFSGSISIPATVFSIGNYAFANLNTNLNHIMIKMEGEIPPTIFFNTFANNITPGHLLDHQGSLSILVPCQAMDDYMSEMEWQRYNSIITESFPYELSVSSSNIIMGDVFITQPPTCLNHASCIKATANRNYHFLRWDDGNTDNPRSLVMAHDSVFVAIFAPDTFNFTVQSNNLDYGSVSPIGMFQYEFNAVFTLCATAKDGYHFLRWDDGNAENPRSLTAMQDMNLIAFFVSDESNVLVEVNNSNMGTVSGGGLYYYQDQINLVATPAYGYHFTQWDDGNTDNPRAITVDQDMVLTAIFSENTYNMVVSCSGTNGSVTGGGYYPYMSDVTVSAQPANNYHFVMWNDGMSDNPRTLTLTKDTVLTAIFAINQYAVALSANDTMLGSVSGSDSYDYMSQVAISATAKQHCHFTQWSDGNTSNPRIITITDNISLTALFEPDPQFLISVEANNAQYGAVDGGGQYYAGEQAILSATANEHYYFASWSDGVTTNPRMTTVIEAATYTAVFEPESYLVSISASDFTMGGVSGGGTYRYGDVITIYAQPFDGYRFVAWSDGDSNATRTMAVEDNITLEAIFEPIGTEGIDAVWGQPRLTIIDKRIVITGAAGQPVAVYDVAGRRVDAAEKSTGNQTLTVPATGVYIVKIGNHKPQKCFVR